MRGDHPQQKLLFVIVSLVHVIVVFLVSVKFAFQLAIYFQFLINQRLFNAEECILDSSIKPLQCTT